MITKLTRHIETRKTHLLITERIHTQTHKWLKQLTTNLARRGQALSSEIGRRNVYCANALAKAGKWFLGLLFGNGC